MSDLKLYELTDAIRRLSDEIAENGGEVTPEQEAFQANLEAAEADKVEAICMLLAEKAYRSKQAKKIAAAEDKASDWLKGYLRDCLEKAEQTRIQTPLHTVSIRNSPPSARWAGDPDSIPAEYARVVPARVEFDARKVLAAYRNGETLPDRVEIVTGNKHVVIQ
jgi:hypothetical protein